MYSTYYGSRQDGYGYNADMLREGFDLLEARADCLGWWSVARRVLRSYGHQPIIRLRRSSDSAERDFYGIGPQGEVSTAELRAWNGWNLAAGTEDLTSSGVYWTSNPTSGTGIVPIRTLLTGQGPNGRNATRMQFSLNGGTTTSDVSALVNVTGVSSVPVNGTQYTMSLWARSNDSNTYSILIRYSNQTSVIVVTPTWTRFTMTRPAGADTTRFYIGLRGAQTTPTSNTADILVSEPQVERAASFSTYEPRETNSAFDSFLVTLYDQSGLARHFTQSTTTLQPIICEQGVPVTENGRLAAKFVAADARRMSVPSSTAMFNALHTTGGTILLVHGTASTGSPRTVLANKNAGTRAGILLYRGSADSYGIDIGRQNVAGVATDGRTVTFATAAKAVTQSVSVLTIDPDNATAASRAQLWFNGALDAATNAETATPFVENAFGDMTLGANSGGGAAFTGPISEVAAFSALISTADRTAWQSRSGNFFTVSIS